MVDECPASAQCAMVVEEWATLVKECDTIEPRFAAVQRNLNKLDDAVNAFYGLKPLSKEPCTARRPVVGEVVVPLERMPVVALMDDGDAWWLAAQEKAAVVRINMEGHFQLLNIRGHVSPVLSRSHFAYPEGGPPPPAAEGLLLGATFGPRALLPQLAP